MRIERGPIERALAAYRRQRSRVVGRPRLRTWLGPGVAAGARDRRVNRAARRSGHSALWPTRIRPHARRRAGGFAKGASLSGGACGAADDRAPSHDRRAEEDGRPCKKASMTIGRVMS